MKCPIPSYEFFEKLISPLEEGQIQISKNVNKKMHNELKKIKMIQNNKIS